ncbi:MAG: hypothetical protein ACJ8F7_14850 [Gemmataceae bacterium]
MPLISRSLLVLASVGLAVGCTAPVVTTAPQPTASTSAADSPVSQEDKEIAAELAKLDPAERAAIEAQGWCAISNDERLGAMGPPVKITLKGQAVYLCCKGCQKRAEADPDKTLAKVEELKSKVKAEHDKASH